MLVSACGTPRAADARLDLGRAALPSPPTRDALQQVVRSVQINKKVDGCLTAPLWLQVDAPIADTALSELIDAYALKSDLSSQDTVACYPAAVAAHLIHKWRVGDLDIAAEIHHPNAQVRAATIRFVTHAHAYPAAVHAALADPSFDVRMGAFKSIRKTKDHEAVQTLEPMIARISAEPPARVGTTAAASDDARLDRQWACSTLFDIAGATPCPEFKPQRGPFAIGTVTGPEVDHCGDMRAAVESAGVDEIRQGLATVLRDQTRALVSPLNSFFNLNEEEGDAATPTPCVFDETRVRSTLAHMSSTVRVLAASTLLAASHPRLPQSAEELARGERKAP